LTGEYNIDPETGELDDRDIGEDVGLEVLKRHTEPPFDV
jgi:hypothetical protein